MTTPVYDTLRLYITGTHFYVHPEDPLVKEILLIDRVSGNISLVKEETSRFIPGHAIQRLIYGIMGVVRLLAGPYLVVITERVKVGEIDGHNIWKVGATEIFSYLRIIRHLDDQQLQDNDSYYSMIDMILQENSFYFSSSYDLTHTMQRYHNASSEFELMGLLERADQRFVWNSGLLRDLASHGGLHRYLLPVMCGFVSIRSCSVGGRRFVWALVSRLAWLRAGARYYMRGLDQDGNAANYVETEQIVEYSRNCCSFVQTRGSIPLYWSQCPNLWYKPVPLLADPEDQTAGFGRHLDEQFYRYGKQTIVNLVDNKGKEKILNGAFERTVERSRNKYPGLSYEYFDFHKECSQLRWGRLSILIDRLEPQRLSHGYFHVTRDGTHVSKQNGVFRTNCIDCLDRTNVVQSLVAKRSLAQQLVALGVISEFGVVDELEEMDRVYKSVWADNADTCARHYTGTGALKTDYTRTGKRTVLGAVKDGWNSSIRYYKNNFTDGYKQDAIDLFLGNYVVTGTEGVGNVPSPLRSAPTRLQVILPLLLIVSLAVLIVIFLLPSSDLRLQYGHVLFWTLIIVSSVYLILRNGYEFVDRPRLVIRPELNIVV